MELLVVITIIGILIALLLPAVQAAREAARNLQCRNNLKQLALGCLDHENIHGTFPTNGWGDGWAPDPDQGFTKEQPGSWLFAILPYVEQESLFNLAAGQPGWPVPASKQAKMVQMQGVVVALFFCPTRRPPMAPPARQIWFFNLPNTGPPPIACRNDYAINAGSKCFIQQDRIYTDYNNARDDAAGPPNYFYLANNWNGISFMRSEIKIADVTDGTSSTFMIGEKYLNPDAYIGFDGADDDGAYTGSQSNTTRFVSYDVAAHSNDVSFLPRQDTAGTALYWSFGSAHAIGVNMAMCDGSVHSISYSIDPTVYKHLGGRNDGHVIDGNKF